MVRAKWNWGSGRSELPSGVRGGVPGKFLKLALPRCNLGAPLRHFRDFDSTYVLFLRSVNSFPAHRGSSRGHLREVPEVTGVIGDDRADFCAEFPRPLE